jgi:hypothetical protein
MRQIEVINQETIIDVSAEVTNVEILVTNYDDDLVEKFALEAQQAAIAAEASATAASESASEAAQDAQVATNQALLASAARLNAQNAANAASDSEDAAALSASSALASATSAELDAIATAADRVQTGLDRQATGADRVQTGLDRIATGADRVQTGIDANTATNQAGVATTQAGIATTQAGIATTQAANALTSANNALNSANAAAASAASAAQVGTSTLLTGFATGANTTIAGTDTILQAFQKAQGQINARVSSNIFTADGTLASNRSVTMGGFRLDFVGSSFTNRMSSAGRLLLGNPTESTFLLDVLGTTRLNGLSTIQGTTTSDSGQLGTELLTTGSSDASWTGSSFATGYTHVAGSTTTLTSTLAGIVNTFYQITYTVTGRTAGSFTIAFGGFTSGPLTATGAQGPQASTTGTLVITPTSDFNGTIVLSIRVNFGSTATLSFNSSSGATVNQIRASSINSNSFFGLNAGLRNTTGVSNTFFGDRAGNSITTTSQNSCFGTSSGQNIFLGFGNVLIGTNSARFLSDLTTSLTDLSTSIVIGRNTSVPSNGQFNQIVIGDTAMGLGSNTTVIGNSSTTFGRWWGNLLLGTSTNSTFILDVVGTTRLTGTLTLTSNIILPTSGGTRIGTATNQLISFWNKTPIAQPTAGIAGATLAGSGGSTITSGNTFGGYTIQQIAQALINIGILA